MSNTIEARVVSITGEEVYRLNGNTRNGDIINAIFNWEKIGGLREFQLDINRENEVTLFPGMRWEFYFKDEIFLDFKKIFTGYTEIIPTAESENPLISLTGKGYYWKLKEKQLTQTFTSTAIGTIINALDYSGLDLDATEFDIQAPSVNITVEFKNKTYIQVLDTLLAVANENYKTNQYIWGVDENRGLYFKPLPSTGTDVNKKLFEGYQFQDPEVKVSDKIVNSLDVFRATQADPKATEFVATYNDTVSQGEYGIRKEKVTVSDYIDTTSIARLANAILEERSDPDKIISISNFYVKDAEIVEGNLVFEDSSGVNNWAWRTSLTDFPNAVFRDASLSQTGFDRILEADFYGISTKPQNKTLLINECDSLDGWTQNTPNSTIIINDDTVLTGRKVFKWARAAGQPAGDYIEYTLLDLIQNPLAVGFSIYFDTYPANITFTFTSSFGQEYSQTIDTSNTGIVDTWLTFNFNLPRDYVSTTLDVLPSAGPPVEPLEVSPVEAGALQDLQVEPAATNFQDLQVENSPGTLLDLQVQAETIGTPEDLEVNYWLDENGDAFGDRLDNIEKVRITLGAGDSNANTIYIDRIGAQNFSWAYSRLTLEKAEYNVTRNFILGNLEFGKKRDTLTDQIKNKVGKGDLAFDMYAKT